mgnify:FL=1
MRSSKFNLQERDQKCKSSVSKFNKCAENLNQNKENIHKNHSSVRTLHEVTSASEKNLRAGLNSHLKEQKSIRPIMSLKEII